MGSVVAGELPSLSSVRPSGSRGCEEAMAYREYLAPRTLVARARAGDLGDVPW